VKSRRFFDTLERPRVVDLTVGAVIESNSTASVGYGLSLANDQIDDTLSQAVTQSVE